MIRVVDSSVHRYLYQLVEESKDMTDFMRAVTVFMDKLQASEREFSWEYVITSGDPTSGALKFIKISWSHSKVPYREVHSVSFYSD